MLELARFLVTGALGQGQPQLDAVQIRRVLGRHLGVADAAAGGHEIDLAGQHQAGISAGIDALDCALEEPAHGLQSSMRVRGDVHAR